MRGYRTKLSHRSRGSSLASRAKRRKELDRAVADGATSKFASFVAAILAADTYRSFASARGQKPRSIDVESFVGASRINRRSKRRRNFPRAMISPPPPPGAASLLVRASISSSLYSKSSSPPPRIRSILGLGGCARRRKHRVHPPSQTFRGRGTTVCSSRGQERRRWMNRAAVCRDAHTYIKPRKRGGCTG